MNMRENHSNRRENGVVIVFFCFVAALLISFLAYSVDMGNGYYEKRKIQIAADAASMAALSVLGSSTNYSTVLSKVTAIANANNVTTAEVTQVHPRCGIWSGTAFTPQAIDTCNATTNAVKVTVSRVVAANFAKIFNRSQFNPVAASISYIPASTAGNCIRPFGVEQSFISTLNLQPGNTFVVSGTQSSGNWGKLDINGNASSATQYTAAMLNDICDASIAIGSLISAGTGNSAISSVFQSILNGTTPPLASQGMIFAVTTDFPNGNSGTVQIIKFIKVDLVSQSGSGQGWQATFRLIDLNAVPKSSTPAARQLVQ